RLGRELRGRIVRPPLPAARHRRARLPAGARRGDPVVRTHAGARADAVSGARIVALPGDGIGPEVTAEAVRVLNAVARRFGHDIHIAHHAFGGAAVDALGEPLPRDTLDACLAADAVLLGAVGGPAWDGLEAKMRPERGL